MCVYKTSHLSNIWQWFSKLTKWKQLFRYVQTEQLHAYKKCAFNRNAFNLYHIVFNRPPKTFNPTNQIIFILRLARHREQREQQQKPHTLHVIQPEWNQFKSIKPTLN